MDGIELSWVDGLGGIEVMLHVHLMDAVSHNINT